MTKGLLRRLAPIILAGAGLAGCVTYQPNLPNVQVKPAVSDLPKSQKELEVVPVESMGIDLGNGYHVESDSARDMLYTLTSIQTGEIIADANKEKNGDYVIGRIKQTSHYRLTPPDKWDNAYNAICDSVDNGDKFISEAEIQRYINKIYGTTKWFIEDENGNTVEYGN